MKCNGKVQKSKVYKLMNFYQVDAPREPPHKPRNKVTSIWLVSPSQQSLLLKLASYRASAVIDLPVLNVYIWQLLNNIMFLKFTYAITYNTSLFFTLLYKFPFMNIPVYLSILQLMSIWVLIVWAIVNNAAINILKHVFQCTKVYIQSGYT